MQVEIEVEVEFCAEIDIKNIQHLTENKLKKSVQNF